MPSIINELITDEVTQLLEQSPSAIFIDPAGLKAEDSLSLRRQLHDVGASMTQTKRRLIARVVPEDAREHVSGPGSLAIVIGEDIAAAAKIVNDAVKAEKVVIKAGIIEGETVDAAGAKGIADLPTKDEARAMFARAVRAPVVKLAKVLRLPYVRLARGLNKHKENQED